jgi:hypothetical protein
MTTDPRTAPEALEEFNRFYSTVHVGEVIAAHPGFVNASRFELVDAAQPAPRWLAVYGMADEAAAVQYLKDNERPWLHRRKYSPWPPARKRAKTVWRMLWQRGASTGSPSAPAEFLLMLGMNTAPELEVLPGYASATAFEIYRAFEPAEAPRFCVLHEAVTDLPPTDVQERDVVWRLPYRRIPQPE